MSEACPSCGAALAAGDPVCPSCGEGKAVERAPVRGSDDAVQYVKIVGILIVVVAVILIVAGMMGPGAKTCVDCRGKKFFACDNCVDNVNKCRGCKGNGYDPGTFSTCAKCSGKGVTATCEKCGGHPRKKCQTCQGTGINPE